MPSATNNGENVKRQQSNWHHQGWHHHWYCSPQTCGWQEWKSRSGAVVVSINTNDVAVQQEVTAVGTNDLGRKQQSGIESRELLASASPNKDTSPLGTSHIDIDSTGEGENIGDSKGAKNKAKIVHKYEVTNQKGSRESRKFSFFLINLNN